MGGIECWGKGMWGFSGRDMNFHKEVVVYLSAAFLLFFLVM